MKYVDPHVSDDARRTGSTLTRCRLDGDFPPEGRFTPREHQGAKVLVLRHPGWICGTKRRYVGPADDPDIAQRVADHKRDNDDLRARRRLVNTMTREGGMIAPDAMSGDIIEALAEGVSFGSEEFSSARSPSSAIRDFWASAFQCPRF